MASLHLAQLHVYPLKGAGGVALEAAAVGARGLDGDRRWMIVTPDGAFVSQRQVPRLALLHARGGHPVLHLAASGQRDWKVEAPPRTAPHRTVAVWGDTLRVPDAGDAAAAWLSAFVGRPVRLVYFPDAVRRPLDARYGGPDAHVGFADAMPLLLTQTASLDDLNARIGEEQAPLRMDRFRPNVVVTGAAPWAEDAWQRLRIGTMTFRVAKGCARCAVPTVDQQTAETGKEPLATLARFRRRDGKVFFGRYLVPEAPGTLRTGDAVEVLAAEPAPPVGGRAAGEGINPRDAEF